MEEGCETSARERRWPLSSAADLAGGSTPKPLGASKSTRKHSVSLGALAECMIWVEKAFGGFSRLEREESDPALASKPSVCHRNTRPCFMVVMTSAKPCVLCVCICTNIYISSVTLVKGMTMSSIGRVYDIYQLNIMCIYSPVHCCPGLPWESNLCSCHEMRL